jgi:hypothetical protein
MSSPLGAEADGAADAGDSESVDVINTAAEVVVEAEAGFRHPGGAGVGDVEAADLGLAVPIAEVGEHHARDLAEGPTAGVAGAEDGVAGVVVAADDGVVVAGDLGARALEEAGDGAWGMGVGGQGEQIEQRAIRGHRGSGLGPELRCGNVAVQLLEPAKLVAFVDAEQEEFVPDDGSADRTAELVVDDGGAVGEELVAGVRVLDVVEVEEAAVHFVGAPLGVDVDVARHGVGDFSRSDTLGEVDLVHGFEADALDEVEIAGHGDGGLFAIRRGVGAIDGDAERGRGESIHGDAASCGGDAGVQVDQSEPTAALRGEFANLGRDEVGALLGVHRVDKRAPPS